MSAPPRARRPGTAPALEERERLVRPHVTSHDDEPAGASRPRRRGWLIRRALLAADLIGLTYAFFLSELALGRGPDSAHTFGSWAATLLFVVFLPLWVLAAKLSGLYDRDEERADYSSTDDLVGVFIIVTLFAWLYERGAIAVGLEQLNTERLTIFWATAVPSITLARVACRALVRRRAAYRQQTIILGAGDVGQLIAQKFLRHPEYGIEIVGFVDDHPKERRDRLGSLTILGGLDKLDQIIDRHEITRVVVAFSDQPERSLVPLIQSLGTKDLQVDVVPRLFDAIGLAFDIHSVEGLPLIGLRPPGLPRSSVLLKRQVDLALSLVSLIILAPAFALIALLIKRDSPGPVFFRQQRTGTDGRTFQMLKFRTMIDDADLHKQELAHLNKHHSTDRTPTMFKIVDDPRVTSLGRILRRYSLDELPQLINVVKGEMSLVGPRPLIPEEDQHVTDWARRRLDLKPGITGPWQVLGRSDIPFQDMLQLDYMYVGRWSLYQDLKIILRTIPAVLLERGAY
jgi:exopolysaccharide biosynthesis polyprenyl glycosylphosphotransferase